jgi:uncharacterized RDD family membrane protein YckC
MFGLKKKASAANAEFATDSTTDNATSEHDAPASTPPARSAESSGSGDYAGFWLRVLAVFADGGMLFFASFIIIVVTSFAGEMGSMIGGVLILLLQLLYWPVMHASARQATFGKAMVGIQVTHVDGDRISMLRSFGRELAKLISALPLGIGFLIAAFTRRKQALHDMIASTLVVRDGDAHIARAIVVTVLGYAVPMIAIPLLGIAVFSGMAAGFLGDMAGDMKKPPAVAAKPAAPKPAAPAAPKPAAPPAPASTSAAPAAAPASAPTAPAATATPASAPVAAPATDAAKSAAPSTVDARTTAGAATAATAPRIEVPPDEPEVKAPTRRAPRAPRAAAAPAPAPDAKPAPEPKPCVIKPVMTDEEIDACRRR